MKITQRALALILTLAIVMSGIMMIASFSVSAADEGKEPQYVRVTKVDALENGQYLLILNRNKIMLPSVVTKNSRTGFDLEDTSAFSTKNTVYGNYSDKEWTLTQTDGGWYLANGQKQAALTNTSDRKVVATLEDTGTVFTISGSSNSFQFKSGGYVFNHNESRNLVNGYDSNPASFSIYKRVDAVSDGQDGVIVLAGSDFQNPNGNTAGQSVVSDIFSSMDQDHIYKANGFLFCGDYDYDLSGLTDDTRDGVNALKAVAAEKVAEENMVFVQGNHDFLDNSYLSPRGNNDPKSGEYGVFVIHNSDYMWFNKDEQTIKYTAQRLIDYLNEKLAAGYDKPVFVVSHLPLHYSMRTKNDGDGQYANYIFDALNDAGKKGLNIIYLYGHDHSNGWDDYLGGASVYLNKGDEILIAQASRTKFNKETLNFTYMNAGYVGYYEDHNGLDSKLSMSAFIIKDNQVTVKRYGTDGLIPLKAAGTANAYKNESGYAPNTAVTASPQTVSLTKVTDKTPIADLLSIPKEGRQYKRINSADELKNGGKYLLVYLSSPNYLMLPSVVTKGTADNPSSKRVGFDIQSAANFGESFAYGDYETLEWTFTKNDNGSWLIGDGKQYAAFNSTSNTGITATLADQGNDFTITNSGSVFTLQSGNYVFNYNSRGLINGYDHNPATFYIYEFTGHVEGNTPETNTPETNTPNPGTGDNTMTIVAVSLVFLCSTAAITVSKKRKQVR